MQKAYLFRFITGVLQRGGAAMRWVLLGVSHRLGVRLSPCGPFFGPRPVALSWECKL